LFKSSVKSFAYDVIYAIVAVFIVFGIMYLILGPPFPPIVVVVSTSMLHENTEWKTWFEEHSLTYTNFTFIDGFDKGDIIITKKANEINIGDVIIYERDSEHYEPNSAPIIHRVVGIISVKDWKFENYTGTLDCIDEEQIEDAIERVKMCNNGLRCIYKNFPKEGNFKFYITKGDNNPTTDQCGLMPYTPMSLIPETQVITKAWILIPKVGYIKIWINDIISFALSPFRH